MAQAIRRRALVSILAALVLATAGASLALDQSPVSRPSPIGPDLTIDGGIGGDLEPELPPFEPSEPLVLRSVSHDWIELKVNARSGTNRLYRSADRETYTHLADFPADSETIYRDEDLRIGRQYCYRLDYSANGTTQNDFLCATTNWRVGFSERKFSTAEKQRVAALFDWRDTQPLPVGSADAPALYYMNVWVDDREAPEGLRNIGVHVQELPVFQEELDGFRATDALIASEDGYAGRWYFALVPGRFYNQIRERVLAQIARGEAPGIRAIVFRRIPAFGALEYNTDPHRASYQYLGERGFEWNGEPIDRCVYDETLGGEICPAFLGWAARKLAGWIEEGAETLVESIRRGIGQFQLLYKDDVKFTARFRVLNTDSGFDRDRYMVSAWRGEALTLPKVRIHVRQGLAAFIGHTDSGGVFRKTILEGVSTQVCVETESEAVEITEFLTEEVVCVAELGKLSGTVTRDIDVRHRYLNVLAAMTDAHDYVEQVMGHDMPKITVLVGNIADTIAVAGRSFAPCMGRVPGAIGFAADLAALAFPPALIASGFAEFAYAVDIVLLDDTSRGVPVHEYGHAVMCHLLGSQGSDAFQLAWTDVIFATADQSAGNDTSYINEAFADFLTSQIVGGTNYFSPDGAFELSEGIKYCETGEDCLEHDFSSQSSFENQVARITSLLHDAFDRTGDSNDGSHWFDDGNGKLLPARLADSVKSDEEIELAPTDLEAIFEHWDERGTLLNESNFLGGLADLLRARGYGDAQVCRLFELHDSGGDCPSFVLSAPWNHWYTGLSSPGALFRQPASDPGVPVPELGATVPVSWVAARPVLVAQSAELAPAAPAEAETGEPLGEYPVALLDGVQKTRVKGFGKAKREAAYALRLGEGWFDAVIPTGERMGGGWSARNAQASTLRLHPAPEFDAQLREMLAASLADLGADGLPELSGPPEIKLKVRADGRVAGRIKIPFTHHEGDDAHRGSYVVKLRGQLH